MDILYNYYTVKSYPSTIWPDKSTEDTDEPAFIEGLNNPETAEDPMAYGIVSLISGTTTGTVLQHWAGFDDNLCVMVSKRAPEISIK